MKTQLILKLAIGCFMVFSSAKAQTVNNVALADLKEAYIEVNEFRQFLGEKTFISVNYGQKKELNNSSETVVKDDKGKYLEYNSGIDFVNKMKPYGYELFQAYAINSGENSSQTKYILKRKSD